MRQADFLMELIFATGNVGKVREVQEICDALGVKYGVKLDVRPMPEKADIPETGTTYQENSFQKAMFVWEKYHCSCIADDSGLEVDALDGAPGIYTARYCDRNFASGIDKLLYELSRLGAMAPEQRKARFECCITLIVDGQPHFFNGSCPGCISTDKCGSGGFGFDPVFIADATPGKCMAELTDERKNALSHRGRAMEEMFKWLKDNNID